MDGNAYVKELGVDRLISHNEKYSDIIINEYIRNVDVAVKFWVFVKKHF